jgi:dienelactone hydrolase
MSVKIVKEEAAMRMIGLVLCAAALSSPCVALELDQPDGIVREAASIPFVLPGTAPLHLDAIVTRPANPGRYPMVVITHGTNTPEENKVTFPTIFSSMSIDFARRGWAAVSVTRRGHGRSEGQWSDGYGGCDNPNYQAAGLSGAQDIIQTVEAMRGKPFVDSTRVLLIGHSAGGLATIAATSLAPKGLVGAINFAGGRGSKQPASDALCASDRLIGAYGFYGKTSRVPTLWIYSENDHYFSPALAREMLAAFTKSGGHGELVVGPPYGKEGHGLVNGPPELWQDPVDNFLRQNHLPTWAQPIRPTPPVLPPPKGARLSDFQTYLASERFEKAFAISLDGHHSGWAYGQRSPEEAAAGALKMCSSSGAACKVHAINNKLAE